MFFEGFLSYKLRTAPILLMPLLSALAMLGLASLITGCGGSPSDRVAVFPAAGQLIWENKPLGGALIVLHPQGEASPKALPSRAQTDAQGNFELTTYDKGDGAPSGEYAVTVEYYPLQKSGDGFLPGPNALPSKYSSPQSSDLRVRITEGENRLPPLILKR